MVCVTHSPQFPLDALQEAVGNPLAPASACIMLDTLLPVLAELALARAVLLPGVPRVSVADPLWVRWPTTRRTSAKFIVVITLGNWWGALQPVLGVHPFLESVAEASIGGVLTFRHRVIDPAMLRTFAPLNA